MEKFKTWAKSTTGGNIIMGAAAVIIGLTIYFVHFSTSTDGEKKYEQDQTAEFGFSQRDTSFSKQKRAYYTKEEEQPKKVTPSKDFFNIDSDLEELNQQIDSVDTTPVSSEIDYQKKADSILAINNQKVRYGERNTNTNRAYRSSKRKISNAESDKEWQEEVNEEYDEFFSASNRYRFSTNDATETSNLNQNFYAVIHNNQSIKANERVRLRLTRKATIGNIVFPKNTIFHGQASFGPNRVFLKITNINQIPVNLTAYDAQDGLPGMYVQHQSLAGEAGRELADDAVNDVDVSEIPGARTIRNIFRRKNRNVPVPLLNNFKLILKQE